MGVAGSKRRSHLKNKKLGENMDCISDNGTRQLHHRTISSKSICPDDEVVFHVGQETVMRIPASKSVLSKQNEVFHAMFCGPYTVARQNLRCRQPVANVPSQQSTFNTPDQIYEPDVDGRAFKNLISFLYGETVDLRSVMTALETLHAAEKYLCEGLMKICATYLVGQFNSENVLYIYQRARMYPQSNCPDDQPSAPPLEELESSPSNPGSQTNSQFTSRSSWCSFLLNSCLEFIDRNSSAVLSSEEFEELDAGTVESIIRRDGLHVQNETEILTALIRWSIFECHRQQLDPNSDNQRHVLGHLLWHVRFTAMSVKESQQAATILESLALVDFPAFKSADIDNTNHLPLIVTKPRIYLSSKIDTSSNTLSNSNGSAVNSCEKTCLAEKLFVCLACIFE